MKNKEHKSGFVSIIGKPNAGKSTLMNQLVGERLSIITSKAQTTRHRIMGIISGDDFQIVYSDTPGILKPAYKLQDNMMTFVNSSLKDADLILMVVELGEKLDEELHKPIEDVDAPVLFLLNKTDLAKGTQVEDKITYWKENFNAVDYIPISALTGEGIQQVLDTIITSLPEHPAYFPKDSLTDKPEKFFASEILREKIFENFKQEVPYSTEVSIEEFKEEPNIIRIRAIIYVERKSQKGIIIGKKGEAIKKIGTEARKDMEVFFAKKIFLETYVKVLSDWRKNQKTLKNLGY